jgi:hypothetical protein
MAGTATVRLHAQDQATARAELSGFPSSLAGGVSMLAIVVDELFVVAVAAIGVLDEVGRLGPEVGSGVIAEGVVDEGGALEAVGDVGVLAQEATGWRAPRRSDSP